MLDSPSRPNGGTEQHSTPGLRVVIVYEDVEAGKHARKTYDYLSNNLGAESDFAHSMWKFDLLAVPKLREIAAKDAADADIVVVSSHGGKELPAPVTKWLDDMLARGGRPLALVALFDCDDMRAAGVRSYMARIARLGGIEFFAQPGRPRNPSTHHQAAAPKNTSAPPAPLWRNAPPPVQPIMTMPRWGINE